MHSILNGIKHLPFYFSFIITFILRMWIINCKQHTMRTKILRDKCQGILTYYQRLFHLKSKLHISFFVFNINTPCYQTTHERSLGSSFINIFSLYVICNILRQLEEWQIVHLIISGPVNPNTMNLTFTASPLSTDHCEIRGKLLTRNQDNASE